MHYDKNLHVDVMATDRKHAEGFLAEIRHFIRKHNLYRGKVLSFSQKQYGGGIEVHFHKLPRVDRDRIILPEGLIERIERQTIEFARQRNKLLEAGRHLKRGLLLHGAPGTGKTAAQSSSLCSR